MYLLHMWWVARYLSNDTLLLFVPDNLSTDAETDDV